MKRVLFILFILQLFAGKVSAQLNLSLDPDSMSLDSFNKEILSEYQSFRDQLNAEYAKFMEEVWKSYPIQEAEKVPEEKQMEPVVYDKEKDEQYLAEQKRLEEEKKLAEEKKQREEEQKQLAEQKKKQEEQQKLLAEEKQKQQEQQQQLAEQQKQQEEQQKQLAEQQKQQDEQQKRLAEEKQKQQQEQQQLAEEKQKQEQEQQRLAQEKQKQQQEQQQLAQEKQKQQEQQEKILAEQKKQQEELKRLQEEKVKQEQERQQLLAERKKLEEEQKQLAEQKKKQEEQQKLLEQQQKQEELNKLLAEKKQKEKEERLLAERKQQQEQQQKALEELQKKQQEQERLLAEKKKQQEEQQRLLAEQQKKQQEQQRLLEEKVKKQEQEQRLLAEKKKKQEEQERLLAEKKKKQEEQQRLLEEKKQKQQEQQQLLAEKKKQQEEQQRQLAEKQRQQEQQQRQLAEKQKQQDEQQRQLAEKKKQQEERERILAEQKKKLDEERSKPIPVVIVPQPKEKPQPKPIGDDKRPKEIVPQKDVATTNSFQFYGTPMGVRWGKASQFKLKGNDEKAFAAGYRELTCAAYNDLLDDCIRLRKEKNLCDWAYYKMLQSLSEAACGKGTNEAVFLQGVLLSQSGYQMRFAYEDNHQLHLLSRINGFAYNYRYYVDNGKLFYLLDGSNLKSLHICPSRFEGEQDMDLDHSKLPVLSKDMSNERRIVSNFVKVAAMTSVNKNIINFFNDYPISGPGQGKDVTLKWFKYGNLPMTKEVTDKLYPQLKEKIQNAPKVLAANMLLSWVQHGLEYMLDEKVWGHDRPFFAEESLYYPYADCEDRAILYSQLVRDLLDLDVVLVYNANPGHLYTAVAFNQEVPGDYIMVEGRKFTVADPTYYGANVGMTMNRMNNSTAKVLLLSKNR